MSKIALLGLALALVVRAEPKKLFIEDRILQPHSRNVTAELTKDIMNRCPSDVVVMETPDRAQYSLKISPGSSVIYADGAAVAVFKARFSVGTLAKEVCRWMGPAAPR